MPGDSSSRRPGPAPAPLPTTPRHLRSGADINHIVRTLEAEWRLGLRTRENTWSPSTSISNDVADKVFGLIKRLFYSAEPALRQALTTFKEQAPAYPERERLRLLHRTLSDTTKKDHGDPVSRVSTPKNEPPKSLRDLLIASQTSQSAPQSREQNGPDPYSTAVDPGSPTDVDTDDDDFVAPLSPSPTPASKSGPRSQASPFKSSQPNGRKRSSDHFINTTSPPKLTKTSEGKQIPSFSDMPPPPLDAARRPVQVITTSAMSSVHTSFNTSISSSQETNNTSANTSFTSNDGTIDVNMGASRGQLMPARRSDASSSFGHSLRGISAQFDTDTNTEQKHNDFVPAFLQGSERAKSSTFGSVDEEGLLNASAQVEGSKPSVSDRRLLQGLDNTFANVGPGINQASRDRPTELPLSLPLNNELTGKASPKTPYYVRNLPEHNLFCEDMPQHLTEYPFFLLFICCRISIASGISMTDLMRGMDSFRVQTDMSAFWSAIEVHTRAPLRESKLVWAAAKKSLEGFTLKGRLVFVTKANSTEVFKLDLAPILAEETCRFQRKFGSDRLLYLTMPSFRNDYPSRFSKGDMKQIEEKFKLWLLETHKFLGRSWRVFHIQPIKRKKNAKKSDNAADVRLVLFAIEGAGINTIPIGQMMNWFIDLKKNKTQNFCKAFARLDLGLTTTIPTFAFKPSQIKRKPDVTADGLPEATEFNDPSLDWSESSRELPVMNDGCSRVSVGAALKIWKLYKEATDSNEPLPSVIQGRIAGAKGMWMISGEPHTRVNEDMDIWIEITDSQLKFEPHRDDETDTRPYDVHRLTFDLANYSHSPAHTDLHISFIPILIDRGVPRDIIARHIVERLDIERQALLEMLSDPVKLYNWISKQSPVPTSIRWQAALPSGLPERIKLLLRSGFQPREAPYLAKVLTRFVRQQQITSEAKLRAPLGKATYFYGIADPLGVLKPGEVHVHFSTPFEDEFTGQTYRNLNGLEVLVSRQPALRRSDIQKVRSISHPKLSHLVDVIVFPVQGEYPLAGKLQGGDYDGDMFWTCWEDWLVQPFHNAPAPMNPPNPREYGIIKDRRQLREVMDPRDLSTVDKFLKEAFEFRIEASLLGQATNFHGKVAYHENSIHTLKTTKLADIHNLLVDAPKQAYRYSMDDYKDYIRYKLKCGNPKTPAHKDAMDAVANLRELDAIEKYERQVPKYKPEHVLDYLYFEKIHVHNVETYRKVHDALSKEEDDDPELRYPFLQLHNNPSDVIQHELRNLAASFDKLYRMWTRSFGGGMSTFSAEMYDKACESCYKPFRELVPSAENATHPDIVHWLTPYLRDPHTARVSRPSTLWEIIRASALYTRFPQKPAFVWHMAGRELAHLKAGANGALDVVEPIFANMKPKPIKAPKPGDEDEEEDDFEAALDQLAG